MRVWSGDDELVASVAQRCPVAFREVHRRHCEYLEAVARRYVGPDVAQEVCQEVFLRLWRHPEGFDVSRGGLRAYLVTMARGRAIDRVRADDRRRRREFRVVASAQPVASGGFTGLDDTVVAGLDGDRVRRVVAQLPDIQREAIELAFFTDHTYATVARLLGVPEGTIKSRIRSGLATLREALVPDALGLREAEGEVA